MLADGPQLYRPLPDGELWMPLEFAAAAFRFGHSMIRDSYDLNRNHGLGGIIERAASTDLLFQYTGRGAERLPQNRLLSQVLPFEGRSEVLPADMVWEADRLCDESGSHEARRARQIDWRISAPLAQHGQPPRGRRRRRPPTAAAPAAPAQPPAGLRAEPPDGPGGGGGARRRPSSRRTSWTSRSFRRSPPAASWKRTPLWFYVLREAEIRGGGNHLGETGSRIVAETIVGLLKGDPTSYLNADTPWDPSQGVSLHDGRAIRTIRDFLQFTGIPA